MNSVRKRKTNIVYMCMESRETVLMNLFTGRNRDTDIEKRLVDTEGKGEGGTNRESSIETYMLP